MKWIIGIFTLLILSFLLLNTHTKQNQIVQTKQKTMKITSPAFENNQPLPKKYSCDGENVNPPLTFGDVPPDTKTLVLIVDDPDAPMGTFDHWVLYNISSTEQKLEENSVPSGSIQGKNGAGTEKFIGACPPSGVHRYFFKLYALDTVLNFPSPPSKKEVEEKMQGHILGQAELVGTYSRQ